MKKECTKMCTVREKEEVSISACCSTPFHTQFETCIVIGHVMRTSASRCFRRTVTFYADYEAQRMDHAEHKNTSFFRTAFHKNQQKEE
jgi:hypothetical protein